jgi:putative membrane-bound dehydrogenase-like protein
MLRSRVLTAVVGLSLILPAAAAEPKPLKVLFLGDEGHHKPADRFRQLEPVFAKRGIELVYTDKADALSAKTLAAYDALVVYANTTRISAEQEKALLEYVEGGKGFVPLHCASYCFLNSPKYIDLVGAQFLRHGTGTFKTTAATKDHPIMKGFEPFESWDETYVHTKHNEKDRTILEYREERGAKEPWTWVRTQGKGRIFYTAWGHDQRTWGHPGFHQLVERGLRWSVGQDPTEIARGVAPPPPIVRGAFPVPEMNPKRTDVKPFEFEEVGAKIPNYRPRGGQGAPLTKMQKPLPAEESQKHIVVPKGFKAELYITEKELGGKPICMTWDERGRLWAALTMDYPNELKPPTRGRDKIVFCEDTDGDGRGDKVTVFAEGLSIPTSMFHSRGGLIVFDATQTVFLKDNDGDGKADVREVMFGTWNQRDTHGGPSNMQYGLDNWIWAMQGYNDSFLRVGGETHRFRQGFFRFKPDASKLEYIRSTNNNTWGLGISEEGIIFGSTANGNPSEYMPIPNRYYESVRGWTAGLVLRGIADTHRFKPITEHVRQVDWHGGYTAAAGHSLYTARNYPKEYWNRTAFVTEPTGKLVGTFVLTPDGSNFRSTNPFNIFASDDEWTAPIMAEVGPDGNVWVLDWYNFIVQHNPTPQGFTTGKGAAYESDLRDKKHGRIYRVVYEKGGELRDTDKKFSLADAKPETLVANLKQSNLFWRRHAQRLLVERNNKDVLPLLHALVTDQSVDEIGLNVGAIHALWTLHGLGALDGSNAEALSAAVAALKHPSAGVRRNAVQVLPMDDKATAAIVAAGMTSDADAQVRLMSLLALADRPASDAAGKAIADALIRDANDKWIPDAAIAAGAKNNVGFLKAMSKAKPNDKVLAAIAVVAENYARGGPVDSIGGVLASLADGESTVADAIVRGLARGWPSTKTPKLDENVEKDLGKLAAKLSPDRRGALVRMASGWGSKQFAQAGAELMKSLAAKLADSKLKVEDRVAAAGEMLGYQPADKAVVVAILEQISPQSSPELVIGLVQSLKASDSVDTGTLLLEKLPSLSPTPRSIGISVMLGRLAWTTQLVAAIDAGKLQITDLSLDQKNAIAEHSDPVIRKTAIAILRRGGALPNADRQKVIEELVSITKEKGDAANGKVIFKNQCQKCHTHTGEGQQVGPDLTGMAVHPKEELLVHLLDPSRSVEGNFRLYRIITKAEKTFNGMLAGESRTAVELIDTEGKKQTILREDIEEMTGSTKSLMPDGFEKQVTKKDLTDLLEFMTVKGKYLPLVINKVATAVSSKGMFYNEDSAQERLVFSDWKPRTVENVPFVLVDPQGDKALNVVLLYGGPEGALTRKMPKSVSLTCNTPAKAIHLLSGISGWGFSYSEKGTTSMIVRIHYANGKTEDHELKNGEHFADYIRRVEVPNSKFAFSAQGRQQVRYLKVEPKEKEKIDKIEFVKGSDATAPIVLATTLEMHE